MKENHENNLHNELPDSELEKVSGGINIGDTVKVKNPMIVYCPKCAKLLMNYEVTITGVRGVLDGHTLYWVTNKCCGHKTSIIDTIIVE